MRDAFPQTGDRTLTRGRIFALGQPVAGDDGAGVAVLSALEKRAPGVELVRLGDASELVESLRTHLPVAIVDAAVDAGPPGTVSVMDPLELFERPPCTVSSHGIGLVQAIDLARTLYPDDVSRHIRIVIVAIDRPKRYAEGLSEAVARSISVAAEAALGALYPDPCTSPS